MEDNLPELRDIHLPLEVSAFPIAYGWWLVLGIIVFAILLTKVFLYLRRYSKARYALRLLENISLNNAINAACQMSEILRRICVYKYKQAAVLQNKEWIEFLNAHCKKKLDMRIAELLINAPYIPQDSKTYGEDDARKLQQFCKIWIGENL